MPALLDSRNWFKARDEHYAIGTDVWALRKANAVRVMKPDPAIVKAWQDELAACKSCPGNPVQHGTTKIFSDGSLYTYQCRSFSRTVNPVKGEIVGRSHCTCDGCW